MKSSLMIALVAGAAITTGAYAQKSTGAGHRRLHALHSSAIRGIVHINVVTGQRTVTRYPDLADHGDSMWANTDITGDGNYFYPLDDPDTGAVGYEAVDWGDFGSPTSTQCVDGLGFAYAGDQRMGIDPSGAGVPGLGVDLSFYTSYNGGNTPGAPVLKTIHVDMLPGHDGNPANMYEGWIIELDMAGTAAAFTFGPSADLDADGLKDFGFSYHFTQMQTGGPGILGPYLVFPANLGGAGTSTGEEDAFDQYDQYPLMAFENTYWFGGGNPPTTPYAAFYMELFGDPNGACPSTGPTCYANCDHSTAVPFLNVNDFLCFQGKFAAGDSYANCDNSTSIPVLNVNDFLCFQGKFAAGCSAP